MNDKNIKPNTLTEGAVASTPVPDLAKLQTSMRTNSGMDTGGFTGG